MTTGKSRLSGDDFYRALLQGFGGVFFCPGVPSGALLLLATMLASPVSGMAALLGMMTSLGISRLIRRPELETASGIHATNGALVGLFLTACLESPSPASIRSGVIAVLIGSTFTTLLSVLWMTSPIGRRGALPFLSIPSLIVVTASLPLLTQYGGWSLSPFTLPSPLLTESSLFDPSLRAQSLFEVNLPRLGGTIAQGVAIIAMAFWSWRLLAVALTGVILGMALGYVALGWSGACDPSWVLLTATPVFTGLAGVFTAGGVRALAYGAIGTTLAFIPWFACSILASDSSIPLLTWPFAVTTLIVLATLRLIPPGRIRFLPDLVPLIQLGRRDGSGKWSENRADGLTWWARIEALSQRPISEFASERDLATARDLIARSHRITVLSGAGLSTESGIPDYRTGAVAWKQYDTSHFRWGKFIASEESRKKYWEMSQDFYLVLRGARPNAAHRAIADLERRGKLLSVVTQNVDRLHQRAGNDAERVIEIHGNEHVVRCLQCGRERSRDEVYRWIINGVAVPHCPACQGILKPDSVAFDQPMPEEASRRALDAVKNADLLLIVGTSLSVQPVASLPLVAMRHGARIIIVNLSPTEMDPFADVTLRGPLSTLLPLITGSLSAN